MKLADAYSRIIAELSSAGPMGAAILLGSTLASGAAERPADAAAALSVADRLATIQEAVSIVGAATVGSEADPKIERVWGYRWFNGGWGGPRRGRWNNFRPRWNNFWRNW